MANNMGVSWVLESTTTAASTLKPWPQWARTEAHKARCAKGLNTSAKAMMPKCKPMATGADRPCETHHCVIKVSEPIMTAVLGSTLRHTLDGLVKARAWLSKTAVAALSTNNNKAQRSDHNAKSAAMIATNAMASAWVRSLAQGWAAAWDGHRRPKALLVPAKPTAKTIKPSQRQDAGKALCIKHTPPTLSTHSAACQARWCCHARSGCHTRSTHHSTSADMPLHHNQLSCIPMCAKTVQPT
jgi:hypothetical protein